MSKTRVSWKAFNEMGFTKVPCNIDKMRMCEYNILSLTVSKVKMPFEPSVLQALRAFLFRFETKKIVFYFPLLCFCIVLIWLFVINSKSVLKWQISCSLSVSSVRLYRGMNPWSFTYAKLKSFKVFRISSHVYLCSKNFSIKQVNYFLNIW